MQQHPPAVDDGTYRNPILNADWSDPDVIRVGDDFYMTASSFHRVPGLPILHSRDLVHWSLIGHALPRLQPEADFAVPQWGCGVWAPALRHRDGRFLIVYPDPDRGLFTVTADDPAGPWSRPRPLKAGRGLIDPCPLWDDDGTAYLVHAWAKSRAGVNNRLTAHRMSPDATELLDQGRVIIDGDALPGYRTLEGPKWYKRDGDYWILAPAGGVRDGWQSAFRSSNVFGPYEDRVVLEQGRTDVNGPHQGAWVDTPGGQDWFLHFQDRDAFGRVVHLQPMHWTGDGWPAIGEPPGRPVSAHPVPDLPAGPPPNEAPADEPSPEWTWSANPDPSWLGGGPGVHLACVPNDTGDLRRLPNLLGRRLPADGLSASIVLRLDDPAPEARAGLTVIGDSYAWIGLERRTDGTVLVYRTAAPGESETDGRRPLPIDDGTPVVLGVEVAPDASCRFLAGAPGDRLQPVGEPFAATAGRWVGAALGLFATAPPTHPSRAPRPAGSARFGPLEVGP